MEKKTKRAMAKRNLQRKRKIAADLKTLELKLRKLQKDLTMFRHFCD